MTLKVNKHVVLYFILVLALLNGPLRLTSSGATSLYRLIAPVAIAIIIVKRVGYYKNDLLILLGFILYSLFVSLVFYNHISFDQTAVLIYVFFIYLIMKEIKRRSNRFNNDFWRFLNIVTHATIVAAWLQYFFHYTVPYMETSIGQPVGVYLSNGNELSEALVCVFILYIFLIVIYKQYKYIPACISILFISFVNDAKLSILGGLISAGILFLYTRHVKKKKKMVSDNLYFLIVFAVMVISIVLLYLINPQLPFRDYKIGIRELFFDNVSAIILGHDLTSSGSLHDRTMAIVYGLTELKNSYFFGIGMGNSLVMLQKSEYILRTAKSMHNILFQFLTEFGYIAIIVYYLLVKRVVFFFRNVNKHNIYLLKAIFAVGFVLISSQSSVGILANYYTIMVTVFIGLLDVKGEEFHKVCPGDIKRYVEQNTLQQNI